VLKDTGEPYMVFTPFKRRALEVLAERWRSPEDARRWLGHLCPANDLPAGVALPPPPATTVALPPAGEAAAWARLNRFTEGPLHAYAARRDFPGIDGTARLSPALKFGVISIRRCFQVARRARAAEPGTSPDGPDTWISELLWRDFYGHILSHFPRVETTAFQERMADLVWEERDDWLAAWQAGRTGYPMVDAGMRQLLAEGWMHNRARMIVGSFLCKDLLLNWQHGERHFMRHLIDGDLAANNGGWQWVASTGTDAQPSFRVFNPTGQGRRFDPDGAYIRRYVPELARVPDEHIHAPSQMPPGVQRAAGCAIGHDYPAPIVDHAVQRDRALALYRLTRAGQPGEAVARPRRSGHGRGTVPAG
jgi:deoxyribodipyrimidine photo-lyase